MKKLFALLLCVVLVLSLSACGGTVNLDTPKSVELSSKYGYYDKSVAEIRVEMHVTPEQADEIFIALVSIGADGEVTSVIKKYGADNTYDVSWRGGVGSREVDVVDGVVSEIRLGLDVLYPLDRSTATLDAQAIENVVALIDGLNADSSRSDYETVQAAFDSLSKNQQKEIDESIVAKLSEYALSTMTIEQAVDSAIEKAFAEKENVTIANGVVSIYLKGSDNLTNDMIRGGMHMEAVKILESLQTRTDITKIALFWSFPLVDVYGNTSQETVMKIQFEQDNLQLINFDSFIRDNFEAVADDYYEHSALSN